MIQSFLSARVQGKLTEGHFDKFAIAREDDGRFMAKHQGKYPMISISFKDVNDKTYAGIIRNIRDLIEDLYREYEAELSSDKVSSQQKEKFKKYLSGSVNTEELVKALRFLSEFLYKVYDQQVVILIDEYDTPLMSGYENNFLSDVCNFIGFTEEEMLHLCGKFECEDKLDDIMDYYNGYRIGKQIIYNPYSVMQYFKKRYLSQFWALTTGDELLRKLFIEADARTKCQMSQLMQKEEICVDISMTTGYNDLMQSPDALWTLLLSAGYLTFVGNVTPMNIVSCQLKIPNSEILSQYKDIFHTWLKQSIGVSKYDSFLKNLVKENVAEFTTALGKYLIDSISYFETEGKKELFYHGLVAGLVASLGDTHWIDSNKKSGYGRYDIMLTPKDGRSNRGIIFEFKHAKNGKLLENEAASALSQIEMTKYSTTFNRYPHITRTLNIGLAFSGKDVTSCHSE